MKGGSLRRFARAFVPVVFGVRRRPGRIGRPHSVTPIVNVQVPPPRPADEAALDPEAMRQPLPNAWYCVGRSNSLTGRGLRAVALNGEQMVLGRRQDGTPFALRDRCPHRGMALSKGPFDGQTLMCPFHGWRFGTDGGCKDVPTLSEHDAADFSRIRVQPFPIRESAGFLWVNPYLGPATAEPLPCRPSISSPRARSWSNWRSRRRST